MDKRYRIVFKGELLPGHDPQVIRQRASRRLGANPAQTDRLFSGQTVILKRGVDMDVAKRYAIELRELGMRILVEPEPALAQPATPAADTPRYRICFAGSVLEGFTREAVMEAAADRLRATPPQLAQMFSGRKTVIKKDLDAEQARRYAARLQSIGMRVVAEAQPGAANTTPAAATKQATPAVTTPIRVQEQRPEPSALTATSRNIHEIMRQQQSLSATEVHQPLRRFEDGADMTATQVEMNLTQTMVDHDLIATNQNLPDLEKTELAGQAYLNALIRDETNLPPPSFATVTATTPIRAELEKTALTPHTFRNALLEAETTIAIPRPGNLNAAQSLSAPVAAKDPADSTLVNPPRPIVAAKPPVEIVSLVLRQCVACGAQQAQGRYCVHCGCELPRLLPEPAHPIVISTPQAAQPREAEPPIADVPYPPKGRPGIAPQRLLLPGVALLGLVCLAAWGLLR
ncbi:hypothetical protein [Viridibacterium curvum]|uniref:SPOR domain-containing protein n=1 Tax=Viridibacterium curvum TaxID=1101404 RepID=A0ABP9QC46_9RHOO